MKLTYKVRRIIEETFRFPRGLVMDRNGAIKRLRGQRKNHPWPGYEHENPGVLLTNRPPEKGSEEK